VDADGRVGTQVDAEGWTAVDGSVLREWRRSRCWDVPEMARRLRAAAGGGALPDPVSLKRMINRWEREGLRTERYVLLYAAALGISPEELPGGPAGDAVSSSVPGAGAEDGDDPVKRREFGVAVLGLLAAVPVPAAGQVRETVGAMAAALHGAAGDVPARDAVQLDRDVMRAWKLRQASKYADLGRLLAGLVREVGGVHAGTAQAVHVYNLASAMCKGIGAHDLSAILADRAYLSAARTGSPLLVGAARMRVANSYLAAGRHAEAVAVAAAAADDLPPGRASSPEEVAVFGSLLLCAAVAAARMGEAAQAWEFLGHAKAAAAVCDREHADVYAVFGPANLAVHGVQVATDLGDGREALRRAERADPGRLPAELLERRTTLLVDIARAQHMQHDDTGSVATLLEAERVAPLEVRYSGAALTLVRGLLGAGPVSGDLRGLAGRLNVAV
jgi:hypothetical protein